MHGAGMGSELTHAVARRAAARHARRMRVAGLVGAFAAGATRVAGSQPAPRTAAAGTVRQLAIEDAIRLASRSSDAVRLALTGVTRARGQQVAARSLYLPRLAASASYSRTLASPYTVTSPAPAAPGDTGAATLQSLCTASLAATATAAQRDAALAQAATCPASPGIDLTSAGFGVKNTYTVGADASFALFAPGRGDRRAAAFAGRRSADIEVTAQRAQVVVDVTAAYFDAELADQLVIIAEASLVESERVQRQAQLSRDVGDKSGYDLLRAQVDRDNQLPALLQRRTNRELAYIQLRQLLDLDPDQALRLTSVVDTGGDVHTATLSAEPTATTTVDVAVAAAVARAAVAAGVPITLGVSDTSAADRAAVREQAAAVQQQESTLRYTRAQRWASVDVVGSYARLAYPTNVLPNAAQFRPSASVGLAVSIPLYTGGAQRANELAAEATLAQDRAQLHQTLKAAALDSRRALLAVAGAEATYAASAQTAVRATRASFIAGARYRQALAVQTEVTDARIAEAQALSARAQAARDLLVAHVRLALLKDLPLPSTANVSTTNASTTSPSTSATTTAASTTSSPGSGGSTP